MKVETIAGQIFIATTGNDGRKRTVPPLDAITEVKANIQAFNEQRQTIETEAAGIVAGLRQSLADGTDTTAHRARMSELKRLDSELVDSINSANEQINAIRSATTKAEAESIAQAAQAYIADTLQPLNIGELA